MSDLIPTPTTITRLRDEFDAALAAASSDRDLQAVRDQYLARKGGVIAALMKAVAAAPPDRRPALGKLTNDLKTDIEARVAEKRAVLDASRPPAGAGDVTLPGPVPPLGHRHPLTFLPHQPQDNFPPLGLPPVGG